MTIPTTTAPLWGEPLPVELMNTLWADRDGIHEALGSAGSAELWLRAVAERPDATWRLLPEDVDMVGAVQDLVALRDAARALAARQTADTRESACSTMTVAAALQTVNVLSASAPVFPGLSWSEAEAPELVLSAARPSGTTVVAELARATVTFFAGETRTSLRACQAPGCVLYFVKEHPRREWCSPGCGNRARVARHYRRHHSEPGAC